MNHKLEFAITAWRIGQGWHADALCQQAEQAESLGFHSYWLPENHFGDQRAIPSPLTLLAAVAARTKNLKLGTTSYLLPIRHPIQAAEEVAVLDQLSGGRLILGIGRGIQDAVFDVFGLPSRDKRARFQSNLDTMLRAWHGEALCTGPDGQPVCLAPLPLQQPHPPLWVAAFGPLALQQAGGLGLPYLCSPMESLDALLANYALHREAAQAAGHTLEPTVPIMRTVLVTGDTALASRVKEALAKSIPAKLRSAGAAVEDWAIIGDRHYVLDRLANCVERLGATHVIGGGRLPAITEAQQLHSHEHLADIGRTINTG